MLFFLEYPCELIAGNGSLPLGKRTRRSFYRMAVDKACPSASLVDLLCCNCFFTKRLKKELVC